MNSYLNYLYPIDLIVLDVSIVKGSIFVCVNHDKIGMSQDEFELLSSSRCSSPSMLSFVKRCQLLNVTVAFEVGSTTISSCSS